MLPIDRFAAILGIATFLVVAGLLSRRVDQRFSAWSTFATIIYFTTARTGHVLQHYESFAAEPMRIFAVQQGGFSWPVGLAAVALFSATYLRKLRMVAWSLIPIAVSGVVAAGTLQLSSVPSGLSLPRGTFALFKGGTVTPSDLSGR